MFHFADPRPPRRPSLTPMIDVVFLLLVFFMLASRFGLDAVLPLPLAGGGSDFGGQPRLVDVLPDGLRLNGIARDAPALIRELRLLVQAPSETIVLRSQDGVDVQRMVTVAELLRGAGFTSLVLVE